MKTRNGFRTSVLAISFALAISLGALPVFGGSMPAAGAPTIGMRSAVAMLRIVNQSELEYKRSTGSYGNWSQIMDSKILLRYAPVPGLNVDSQQPVPDYVMVNYVSADGSHYIYSIRSAGKQSCAPSFYTDEGGTIFQAKQLGCR